MVVTAIAEDVVPRPAMNDQESIHSWIFEVRQRLSTPPPTRLPAGEVRQAAVLVPLYVDNGELWTLLTKRSDSLPQHRGQIAFPGGGREIGEDPWDAALRETHEELGIEPSQVIRVGELDEASTPSGFHIVPCVGAVPYPLETTINDDEIAEVFSVPLLAFTDYRIVEDRLVKIDGVERTIRVYHVGKRQVWGLTARIVQNLLAAAWASNCRRGVTRRSAGAAVGYWLLLAALLLPGCTVRSFVYPVPGVEVGTPPAGFEEVDSAFCRGGRAMGWHHPGPASGTRPAMIFFHGNGENLETLKWSGLYDQLLALDAPVLVVDYPGYGRSTGQPSEQSLKKTAEAALRWMDDGIRIGRSSPAVGHWAQLWPCISVGWVHAQVRAG